MPWLSKFELPEFSIEVGPELYPHGRFARLYDPEGTAIGLWEPAGRDSMPWNQARK